MKLDLLAIAAHPDDIELTCGGTLIKMARRGYKTGILDLTRGEMGTRGTPELRARESAKAARILGVKVRENAGLPDAGLALAQDQKLEIAQYIRRLRPHTVILLGTLLDVRRILLRERSIASRLRRSRRLAGLRGRRLRRLRWRRGRRRYARIDGLLCLLRC